MDKELLKQVLIEQNSKSIKPDLIKRDIFHKIKSAFNNNFIIIISGVRRCGKSTLLDQIRTDHDGYYVNFDDERLINFEISDFQTMYELLIELFGEKNTFFFDEIQNIKGWERFVRRLHDEGQKIFITGSNASMLSKELGTHLTGRHLSYSLYPFSFIEFIRFKNQKIPDLNKITSKEKSKIKKLFREYLTKGGFPEYLKTNEEDYLKNTYENIIYRDIISRYNLPNEKTIKETALYAASNISKEISFNKIKNLLNLTSATTVKEYFEYLNNTYLAFLIPRYDASLKKQIYYNKKMYFIDAGMAKSIGFRPSHDFGRMVENLDFLKLKKENQSIVESIYFHKDKHECDFVLRKGIKIVYAIQVTKKLGKNKERELSGLIEAMQKYKLKQGLILTEDDEDIIKINNKQIIIKPVWKYLIQ